MNLGNEIKNIKKAIETLSTKGGELNEVDAFYLANHKARLSELRKRQAEWNRKQSAKSAKKEYKNSLKGDNNPFAILQGMV